MTKAVVGICAGVVLAMLMIAGAGCRQRPAEQAVVPELEVTSTQRINTDEETNTEEEQMPEETQTTGQIVAVTEETFESEVLQAEVPVLVDFSADWCGPCRMLHPTLEKIAEKYAGRAKVVQVDVDEAGSLAASYGVRGIPALFVFKGGQVVDQTVGLQPESNLTAMLDRALE